MSKTLFNISIFVLFSLSAVNAKECKTLSTFNTFYSKELNYKTLEELFSHSLDEKGQGSFGLVKTITFNGATVAAKRVKVASRSDYNLQQREINFMDLVKGSQDFPSLKDCATYEENSYTYPKYFFILQEALFKDFKKPQTKNDFTTNIPLYDRIQRYKEIAQGLNSLHKNDIVHEDLKPENIMTADRNFSRFKIIDLGMAGKTTENVIGGSPLFNSPEKINCTYNCKMDPKHDMWAFALTVADIEAKSRYIFQGIPDSCIMRKFTQTCQTTLLTNVGKVMNDVFTSTSPFTKAIKNCLAFDPNNRWSAQQVIQEIERIQKPTSEDDHLSQKASVRNVLGNDLDKLNAGMKNLKNRHVIDENQNRQLNYYELRQQRIKEIEDQLKREEEEERRRKQEEDRRKKEEEDRRKKEEDRLYRERIERERLQREEKKRLEEERQREEDRLYRERIERERQEREQMRFLPMTKKQELKKLEEEINTLEQIQINEKERQKKKAEDKNKKQVNLFNLTEEDQELMVDGFADFIKMRQEEIRVEKEIKEKKEKLDKLKQEIKLEEDTIKGQKMDEDRKYAKFKNRIDDYRENHQKIMRKYFII
jgi:serine/threonine protein kinase